MNILPISTAEQTAANQTPIVTTGPKTLGQEDFLKLIAVQMKSQDPLNPMKDTEFISQMANFTSLEQMKNLTTSFETFVSQQRSVDAQSYLGKTVTLLAGETGTVSGQVSGITFEEGMPRIVVNGTAYDPALVTSIQVSAN
jgi:flagellar basal-body rod modification protein FlgD